ncbi:hypothetical protein H2198_008904 [Neophaeococcomyces mojaviensis]|uniref:Uncharacterized protein n=1 Tax=Neophaeococcomyces mojaviensis TaxID=3383035 RepID=A0ACC2ZW01_9EURO|nr:hypothetical protein H2198_008904 [Knufia sp. JES_112]
MDEIPVFRAVKRRKQTHKQGEGYLETGSEDENISHLVKARTQPRARLKGVQFSNQKSTVAENANEVALIQADSAPSSRHGITERFVGSTTGQVVNVDKHMYVTLFTFYFLVYCVTGINVSRMAFVDQEMARKRQDSFTQVQQTTSPHEDSDSMTSATSEDEGSSNLRDSKPHHETSYHQLAEVDLDSSTPGLQHDNRPKSQRRPRKPRLGRDGKPFRPRPRKRRASEDIARDGLVEQVLREHGLSTYDPAKRADEGGAEAQGNDEAADERMVAEFQQQFLDAAAEKQQQRQAKSGPGGQAKGPAAGAASVGGPRLGGSRSARAKMAAMQASEAKPGVSGK